jgi:hypothetical protein
MMTDINGHSSPTAEFTAQCTGRFPDYVDLVPSVSRDAGFKLSQTYPAVCPPRVKRTVAEDRLPRRRQARSRYLMALRAYIYEGMIAADFRPGRQSGAPLVSRALDVAGKRPREFLRGMTRTRPISGARARDQNDPHRAELGRGLYNDAGAVCRSARSGRTRFAPDPGAGKFRRGHRGREDSVFRSDCRRLHRTRLLAGSRAWIVKSRHCTRKPLKKGIGTCDCCQMDVAAVRIRAPPTRAGCSARLRSTRTSAGNTGWTSWCGRLMWGADPKLLASSGQKPSRTQVNRRRRRTALNHLGWGGRMNGPVDIPRSSVSDATAPAQVPKCARRR